jgi:hypothetical protein
MAMIVVLVVSNIIAAGLAIGAAGQFAKLSLMPFYVIVPMTLILCVAAAYAAHYVWWDILTFFTFSVLGYLMKLFDWPRPPLLVAVVLGGQLEGYLWLSNARYGWEWLIQPGVLAILALVVVTLIWPIIRSKRRGKSIRGEAPEPLAREHRIGDIVFLLVIMALLYAAFEVSSEWALRGSLVIYFLAGIGIPLGLIQIYFHLRAIRSPDTGAAPPILRDGLATIIRRTVESFAWLVGLAAGVWLIGFHITVGIFAIAFIRVYRGSWRWALIIFALAEGFVMAVFDWLLKVFWPVPVLFEPFIENWY